MCVLVCLSVYVSVSACVERGQVGNELSPSSTPLLTDVPVAGVTVRVLQDGKPRLNQWPRAGDAEVGGREGPARASLLSGFSSTGCKALLSTRCDQEDSQAWLTHHEGLTKVQSPRPGQHPLHGFMPSSQQGARLH